LEENLRILKNFGSGKKILRKFESKFEVKNETINVRSTLNSTRKGKSEILED